MRIRLAFSPDSDDIFMFWALLSGKIDCEGLVFEAERADTETLNARAAAGELDVIAVSIARYAAIARDYLLLRHGMSVGRGYGPVVVAPGARELASLEGARIGVPGLRTTAYLVLRLLLPRFEPVVVPISPYARAFSAVRAGEVEAALLIHEGRLTYEREGFARVCDIGEEWARLTGGLPLPLGGNVIHKKFDPATRRKISGILTASIQYSLDHRAEAVQHALQFARDMGRDLADKFVGMYVNHWTLDYGERGRESIRRFLGQAFERGLIPHRQELEFVT